MAEYSYPRIDFKMSGFAKKEGFGRRSFLERSAAANAGAFVLPRFSIGQAAVCKQQAQHRDDRCSGAAFWRSY